MARIEYIPEPSRTTVLAAPCPSFDTRPWVSGKPLAERRVAIVSSAALFARTEPPFQFGSTEFRLLPDGLPEADILMSHVSINFDRAGFQRDINVVYPVDRLHELAARGVIGGVAPTHYSTLGSTDPDGMAGTADAMAARLRAEQVDSVLLSPV